jgi:hypothetical protein
MPQADAAAGDSPTCNRKRRKLDGTLAPPVSVDIEYNEDRDKDQQPKGLGILKMQCTNIHFDSNSDIKGDSPETTRIYKKRPWANPRPFLKILKDYFTMTERTSLPTRIT